MIGKGAPLAAVADCFKRCGHDRANRVNFRHPALAPIALAAAIFAASLAAPAGAVPGGMLGTLLTGKWRCELPGDATVVPVAKPEYDFRIVPDSSYRVGDRGEGTYLRLSNKVTMTSGPFAGVHFVADTDAMVHRIEADGKPGKLRCVHAGSASFEAPPEKPAVQ
jgi:hypothetical protein